MVSGRELWSALIDEVVTGAFESSVAVGASGNTKPEAGAGLDGVAAGAVSAGGLSAGFAGSDSLLCSSPFTFGKYCPNCRRCQAVYPATANSTSITNVLMVF